MGVVEESVRVMFHLNGYTRVLVECTEGVGMADGGIYRDLWTEHIPRHLRAIGSRFIVRSVGESTDVEIIDSIGAK